MTSPTTALEALYALILTRGVTARAPNKGVSCDILVCLFPISSVLILFVFFVVKYI